MQPDGGNLLYFKLRLTDLLNRFHSLKYQRSTPFTGSRSTFEFPSRVNFPVPVYTVSPGHWLNKAGT